MEFKQAIVVRTDLQMGKGKIAVQVAHAAVSAVLKTQKSRREWLEAWLEQGQKKVVLKVSNLDELLDLYRRAKEEGLPAVVVRDAGLTQLEPGTITAIAIGPAPAYMVDKVTGTLKLL